MDLMLDFNINGEVLIPLENSNFLSEKPEVTYKDLSNCSYDQFRNVLFQGELIKFYILLKSDNIEPSKIKTFFENLYFKIEFESTATLNIDNETQSLFSKTVEIEKTINDLFTTNSEKMNEKNYEYENVLRKSFDEESKIELYEVYKQIIVPKNFLNVQLIMKLQILTKNEDAIDFKENSDTYLYYKTGHFVNVQKYKVLKTLFKEIKVVKALDISETKQTDLTLEASLLQLKLNNITGDVEYEDESLKNSKFLKKGNNTIEKREKNFFGNDLTINEIEILEDETTMDEKETEKVDLVKKYLLKKASSMQKDTSFHLLEKNLPLLTRPGEDYWLSVIVKKNSFLTDSDILSNANLSQNELNTNKIMKKPESIPEETNNNNITQITPNKEQKRMSRKRLNSNAIVISRKSVFSQTTERLSTLSSIISPLYAEMPLTDIYMKTLGNKIREENATETNTNTVSLRDLTDDNIKIFYITPVLLYISSRMFYEKLFMCLQLKWYQELNRLLKIEIKIPEEIYLYDYFEVRIKIRNISSKAMNLLIEMKENEDDIYSDIEFMPGIISQIKFQSLGMFNCNEDKIIKLNFLSTKLGFNSLPNFAITDTCSNRRFYIVQSNKIFIKENTKESNAINKLNRLISKNING
jgi:hypothetical protein